MMVSFISAHGFVCFGSARQAVAYAGDTLLQQNSGESVGLQ